jgi:hypothetical protein
MTEEQQRIAIAEACGWHRNPFGLWGIDFANGVSGSPPDYLNDLNAMHEAEKIFDHALYCRYINELCDVTIKGNNSMYMATAVQRAEAFLKTINKWED